MARNPPPIQEQTTDPENGRFPQVWIRWFNFICDEINNLLNPTDTFMPIRSGFTYDDSPIFFDAVEDRLESSKDLLLPSASLFVGEDAILRNNGGILTQFNAVQLTNGLLPGRNQDEFGTFDFVSVPKLNIVEWRLVQPFDGETRTIENTETVNYVFDVTTDGQIRGQRLRGTEGLINLNIFVAKDPSLDNTLTNQELIDLPRDQKIEIINGSQDPERDWDLGNPSVPEHTIEYADEAARLAATGFTADDVGLVSEQLSDSTFWQLTDFDPITWEQRDDEDYDEVLYKVPKAVYIGRKLIVELYSPDGGQTTVKGQTLGGQFIAWFWTNGQDRFFDNMNVNGNRKATAINDTDSPYDVDRLDQIIIADTSSGPVTINLESVDSSLDNVDNVRNVLIKKEGINDLTVIPQLGETIDGLSSLVLGTDDPAFYYITGTPSDEWKTLFGNSFTGPRQVNVDFTPFTITDEDILLVNPGVPATDIEINLPKSIDRYNSDPGRSKPVTIKNIHDKNDEIVKISPDGSEEIDGNTDYQLCQKESVTLVPDGSNWWITSNIIDEAYGFMCLVANATPTSGTGDNKIAGTYGAPTFINKFTHASGTLTYTGPSGFRSLVQVSISCITNADNFEIFKFSLRINNVTQQQTGCATTSNSDDPDNVMFQNPVVLNNGDTIEVYGEHVSGGTDFTIEDMQVSAR